MAIDTQNLAYKTMAKDWALPNALWGDTPAMREAGKDFLPQRHNESTDAYKTRLSETTLVNYFGSTIKNIAAKMFQTPIQIGENIEAHSDWFSNFDLAGSNVNDFGMELFKSCLKHGVSYVLIDAPKSEKVDTLAEQRDLNLRPYCTHVSADQLIGWKTIKVDSTDVLSEIRISESIIVDTDDFEQEKVDQIRRIYLNISEETGKASGCTYEVYRNTGKNVKKWELYESGLISLDYIPLVAFYTNRTGFMMGETYFKTLAHLNHQHWQSSSYQRNILNVARIPRMVGFGFEKEEIDAFKSHGVKHGIFSTNPDAKASWMEAKGESIAHGERDLADIESKMMLLSLDPILKKAPSTELATVANIEASKANSVMQMWAESLQRTMVEVVRIMIEMAGDDAVEPELKVNDDFKVIAEVEKRVKELREMHNSGQITTERLLNELKRIGFFDEEFDVSLEIEKLEEQSDPVGVGPIIEDDEDNE